MGTDPGPAVSPTFESVIREFGSGLFRVALAYGATTADAEDLYQETCYAIWRALRTFRGDASIKTFVWRIAHHRGLTFRARRRHRLEELGEARDVADTRPGVEERLSADGRRALLLTAIRRLSDAQCEVLLLALEGLSHAEMGEVLGISANAVGVRLNRARNSLRRHLDPREFA